MNVRQSEGEAVSPPDGRRLDSWKEIAVYLNRDVATARRWEKREGLPVHRHQHEKLGSVFAHTLELDAWAEGRRRTLEATASEDTGPDGKGLEPTTGTWRRVLRGRFLPWAVAAALAVFLAGSLLVWRPWIRQASGPSLRLGVDLGAVAALAPANVQFGDAVVLSPDGATIAFVAQADVGGRQLYVRRLHELEATALSGTENVLAPFFSPDGQWIAFFADEKLKRVAVSGGAPIVLADATSTRGGAWGDDGTIVFAPHQIAGTRLLRVPASGGSAEPVTNLDRNEVIHLWPDILPGGDVVLYTASSAIGAYNDATIVAQSLATGARKVVQTGAYHARYIDSGHLVFVHDGTLFATAFDADRLEVIGAPVPVLSGLASNVVTGGAQFSVAKNGTLLYLPGPGTGGLPIYWMDREARTSPLRSVPSNWISPRFSPDGRQLALEVRNGVAHVWLVDWARDAFTRLSRDAENELRPVWTVDGKRIVFASSRGDRQALNLYWRRADGSGAAERLTESQNAQEPSSWHPSGTALAFEEINPGTRADVMILPLEGSEGSGWKPGKPTAFLNGAYREFDAAFSPDGRWLAYASMESGRPEVYVRRYPGADAQVRIGEGANPVWSRARNELLYGSNGQIMAVDFTVDGGAFRSGRPHLWTEGRLQARGIMRMFDLHVDGERLALAPAPSGARLNTPVFVTNFFDDLRRVTGRAR